MKKLVGTIKIPTEIFDFTPEPSIDMTPWKNFTKLHDYLEEQFPVLHSTVKVEKPNTIGLLYTWEGSDSSLKPLLLMAHQDVVPVDPQTLGSWTHPPYEGFYDKESDTVYGRGSNDVKPLIVSHLESVEKLIKDGFKPRRTVLISLGCDEEASGLCAARLSQHILKRYGPDSIYAILDEGGGVLEAGNDKYIAMPVTTEKGYLDAEITLFTPGGHSSVPPDHTSIGVIAQLLVELENNPYAAYVSNNNPSLDALRCFFENTQSGDKKLRELLRKNDLKKLGGELDKNLNHRYLFRTSQAIDIIKGGIKSNALPESVAVLVNNRIAIHSSVEETLDHILLHLGNLAKKYDLGVKVIKPGGIGEADTITIKPVTEAGEFVLRVIDPLEPAPISPSYGSGVWDIISGTTVNTYMQPLFGDDNTEVFVTPALGTGNTDTKSYWNLTKNIYRYTGSLDVPGSNAHTVDEIGTGKSLISSIAFMYQYIANVDRYSADP